MPKPLIGITCDINIHKTRKKNKLPREQFSLNRAYWESVIAAGGIPILLAGAANTNDILEQLNKLDGLILTGGMDHDPALYGAKKHRKTRLLNPLRQKYEIAIAGLIKNTQKPVLGICLGCQTLNIAFGGTLIQDIPTQINTNILHIQKENRATLTHEVQIKPHSRLYQIIKKNKIKTNSFHHQSVESVAPGFDIVAQTKDGVIESIEYRNKQFILGIQWHPEELIQYPEHLLLFQALIKEAKR